MKENCVVGFLEVSLDVVFTQAQETGQADVQSSLSLLKCKKFNFSFGFSQAKSFTGVSNE